MKSARVLTVVCMFLVALSTYGGVYWYASRVIDQLIVKGKAGIDLVVQALLVNGFAIGVVREPVHVDIQRIEIEPGICRRDLAR